MASHTLAPHLLMVLAPLERFLYASQAQLYKYMYEKLITVFVAGKGPYFQSNREQREEVYIPSRAEKRSVAQACECLPNISLFAGHLRIIRGKSSCQCYYTIHTKLY